MASQAALSQKTFNDTMKAHIVALQKAHNTLQGSVTEQFAQTAEWTRGRCARDEAKDNEIAELRAMVNG